MERCFVEKRVTKSENPIIFQRSCGGNFFGISY